ncbi:hypothetical protein ACFWIA_22360 [Streptomyces sp. NPDC127068]|uniref:hypothetical protein n=1 Tax=Streptomyces sp. NPDC127068 TaxID=3347127 RepID=UPI00364AADEC
MWPGQQQPGGEQNPQAQNPNPYQQPGYQQPNPYQQPGYQQPNPYAQQPGQQPPWGAPTVPAGPAVPGAPGGDGGGGGSRTKVVAIGAALAVLVAAGVTGFLVLGGEDEKEPAAKGGDTSASASAPAPPPEPSATENPRDSEDIKPTIAGWKVVYNPKRGVAFDVPANWEVDQPGMSIGFEDTKSKKIKPLIVMSAPAYYKSKWCESDDEKDGSPDSTALATVGTKGANGATSAEDAAVRQAPWWVYGGYTQPDRKSMTFDEKGTPFTTTSGIEGSIARAHSTNTPKKGKCVTDGKSIAFGFKNSKGDYVAWNMYGAKGVKEEVPDSLITQILKTVRLHGEPTD